jgi:hypothetical protein
MGSISYLPTPHVLLMTPLAGQPNITWLGNDLIVAAGPGTAAVDTAGLLSTGQAWQVYPLTFILFPPQARNILVEYRVVITDTTSYAPGRAFSDETVSGFIQGAPVYFNWTTEPLPGLPGHFSFRRTMPLNGTPGNALPGQFSPRMMTFGAGFSLPISTLDYRITFEM